MRTIARSLLAISLAAVVGGCATATEPALPRDAVALEVRPFVQPDLQYFHSGATDRQRLVLDDAEEWAEIWHRITEHLTPQPPVPVVDFSTEMVVVAAMGSRPSGGYRIVIDEAGEVDGRVFVVVREISPGRGCMVTAALTAPVAVVRIPRRAAPVTFIERAEVSRCG